MVEATWLGGFPRRDRAHCAFCCAAALDRSAGLGGFLPRFLFESLNSPPAVSRRHITLTSCRVLSRGSARRDQPDQEYPVRSGEKALRRSRHTQRSPLHS